MEYTSPSSLSRHLAGVHDNTVAMRPTTVPTMIRMKAQPISQSPSLQTPASLPQSWLCRTSSESRPAGNTRMLTMNSDTARRKAMEDVRDNNQTSVLATGQLVVFCINLLPLHRHYMRAMVTSRPIPKPSGLEWRCDYYCQNKFMPQFNLMRVMVT